MTRVIFESFIDRVFGGRSVPALLSLVEAAELTPQQLSQLRAMLDRANR